MFYEFSKVIVLKAWGLIYEAIIDFLMIFGCMLPLWPYISLSVVLVCLGDNTSYYESVRESKGVVGENKIFGSILMLIYWLFYKKYIFIMS